MNAPLPRRVTLPTTAVPQPTGQPLRARLCWNPADPLAVTVSFRTVCAWVDWVLARELVAAGLLMPAGVGDVRLEPVAGDLQLLLDNGREQATMLLPGDDVAQFLALTYQCVPLGAKPVEFGQELALLLNGGPR